jgi:hypothetical protein
VRDERQLALDFIRANWPTLAAAAWRHHLHHGRGALIVSWRVLERWNDNKWELRIHPFYTAEPNDADLGAMISEYDPATSIVIAFSRSAVEEQADAFDAAPARPIPLNAGDAYAAMTVTAVPTPPEAHRASGH